MVVALERLGHTLTVILAGNLASQVHHLAQVIPLGKAPVPVGADGLFKKLGELPVQGGILAHLLGIMTFSQMSRVQEDA